MNEVEKAEIQVLFALFVEHYVEADNYVDLTDLYESYGLKFPREWVESVVAEWEAVGWVEVSRTHDGSAARIEQLRLTAVLKRLLSWLNASKLTIRAKNEEIFSDSSPPSDVPMIEGWKWFTYETDVGSSSGNPSVPAADRIVRLDHNSADYNEIARQLADVTEAVRGCNSEDFAARDRILASLDAASVLWNAVELRIIQIKVGVLMVAEDAAHSLAETAKSVVAALLVDTIKAFVRNHLGVDLDRI